MQLDDARKQLEARQKLRTREEARLRAALASLASQAAGDAQQVVSAQKAHQELLSGLPDYMTPPLPQPARLAAPPKGTLPVGKAPTSVVQPLKAAVGRLPVQQQPVPKGVLGRGSVQKGPTGNLPGFTGPLGKAAAAAAPRASVGHLSGQQPSVHQTLRHPAGIRSSPTVIPKPTCLMRHVPLTHPASLSSPPHAAGKYGSQAAQGEQADQHFIASRAPIGAVTYASLLGNAPPQASHLPANRPAAASAHCTFPPSHARQQSQFGIPSTAADRGGFHQLAPPHAQQKVEPPVHVTPQMTSLGPAQSLALTQRLLQSSGVNAPHRHQLSAQAAQLQAMTGHMACSQSPSYQSASWGTAGVQMTPRAKMYPQAPMHTSPSPQVAHPSAMTHQPISSKHPFASPNPVPQLPAGPKLSHETHLWATQSQHPPSTQACTSQAGTELSPSRRPPHTQTAHVLAAAQQQPLPSRVPTQTYAASHCTGSTKHVTSGAASQQPVSYEHACARGFAVSSSVGLAAGQAATAAQAVQQPDPNDTAQVCKATSELLVEVSSSAVMQARQNLLAPSSPYACAQASTEDQCLVIDGACGLREAARQPAVHRLPQHRAAQVLAPCTAQVVSKSTAEDVPKPVAAQSLSRELLAVFTKHSEPHTSPASGSIACSDQVLTEAPNPTVAVSASHLLSQGLSVQILPLVSQASLSHASMRPKQSVLKLTDAEELQRYCARQSRASSAGKLSMY